MADKYIRSRVNTLHRYCISRKKTNIADKIIPIPILNTTRQRMGMIREKNAQVNTIPSKMQNRKKTISVSPKLISVCRFFESRKRYFGTLILVKIFALLIREVIPWDVDSLK